MSGDDMNYEDSQRRWPAWWIVFPLLFALSLFGNLYLFYKYYKTAFDANGKSYEVQYKTMVSKFNAEKADLNQQLDDIKLQLDQAVKNNTSLLAENSTLKDQLDAKTLEIARKLKSAASGNTKALLEAKAEIEKLKNIQKLLQFQNDSLSSGNRELLARLLDNESLLNEANQKSKTLEEQKNTLDTKIRNSTLSVADLRVVGVRVKGSSEEETFKANRANKLKITFTLLENELVEPGDKEVTIRLIGTNSEVLTEDNPTLTDSDKLSTMTKTITYNNELLKNTLYYSQKAAYKKGNYTVELIHNDKLMGRAAFILR